MPDKIKLKFIEIEANKLVPGAKYIFVLDAQRVSEDAAVPIGQALGELLGYGNFILLRLLPDVLKVYSVPLEVTYKLEGGKL